MNPVTIPFEQQQTQRPTRANTKVPVAFIFFPQCTAPRSEPHVPLHVKLNIVRITLRKLTNFQSVTTPYPEAWWSFKRPLVRIRSVDDPTKPATTEKTYWAQANERMSGGMDRWMNAALDGWIIVSQFDNIPAPSVCSRLCLLNPHLTTVATCIYDVSLIDTIISGSPTVNGVCKRR